MTEFRPTQYEAKEGRDGFIARPRPNGKIEVFLVPPNDDQRSIGVVDTLEEAEALKAQVRAERSSALTVYELRENDSDRWVLEVFRFVRFSEPETAKQRFDTEAEALAELGDAVLHKTLDDGTRQYTSKPDEVGPGRGR